MVSIGTMLALLGLVYLVVRIRRRRLPGLGLVLPRGRARGAAGPVALIAGWVTTEVGRQPWVVYRVMPTSAAVTGAGGIPVGYGALVVTYLALAVAVAWILRRLARAPDRRSAGDAGARPGTADAGADRMLHALPLVFVLAGVVLYVVLGGRRLRRRRLAAARRAAASAATASASTPTTRWRRCGRPTTCG